MPISLQSLKDKFKNISTDWKNRKVELGARSVYSTICATAVWPLIQAVLGGHTVELHRFFSELGIHLIAHKIIQWTSEGKVNTEKEVAHVIETEVESNEDLRAKFDKFLGILDGQHILNDALRESYLNRTFELSRQLSVAGIDPQAASNERELNVDLDAVYTALLTLTPEAHVQRQQGRLSGEETYHQSALEQLNQQQHLVILGDAGSGKSTFVNFVTMCMAGDLLGRDEINLSLLTKPLSMRSNKEEQQSWSHIVLLPVRIILRDFAARGLPPLGENADASHLWEFFKKELTSASIQECAQYIKKELLEKGGMVLFDGLDEVPDVDQRRTQIKQMVEDFVRTYPKCRIVVTSRTYTYQKQEWRLRGFSETTLAPFNKEQICSFIDRWYEHHEAKIRGLNRDDARGRAEQLKHAILHNDRLFALAERPLLLTLMASLHAWRGGDLPEKREKLYSDAVELLLYWWEKPKIIREANGSFKVMQLSLTELLKVGKENVLNFLKKLAFDSHKAQKELSGTFDISEKDLVYGLMKLNSGKGVILEELVKYLSERAGILLPRGNEVYAFPHRTFQEYLAACFIADNDNFPALLAGLVREDPNRWREVALLASAQSKPFACWAFVEELSQCEPETIRQNPVDVWCIHIAAHTLAETVDLKNISVVNQGKLLKIKRCLEHIIRLREFPPRERALAGVHLAKLGDERHEVMTIDNMQFCKVPRGPFWMGEDYNEHLNEVLSSDFWISKYPITQKQFLPFVNAGGYNRVERYWKEASEEIIWREGMVKGRWDDEFRAYPYRFSNPLGLSNHPVVGITWYEALAFTRWLTEVWKGQGKLPVGISVTLPSEAEWEKAARGGVEIPDKLAIVTIANIREYPCTTMKNNNDPHRIYPWGSKADSNRANYDETGIGATSAVGCFPGGASPYGCEDMGGNVWEWTRSLWGDELDKPDFKYPYKPDDGREDIEASDSIARVLRGGSFNSNHSLVRCASRYWSFPVRRYDFFGFRVVLSPFISGL